MSNTKRLKVLVIDDTAIYRKILSEAVSNIDGLELAGTAPRGAIGLQKLKTTPCDLVFLDIFMPDMDGVETLMRIKEEAPNTTVVMISGATTRDAGITIKALREGAADFIPKPQASSLQEGMTMITAEIKRVIRSLGLQPSPSKPVTRTAPSPVAVPPPARPLIHKAPPGHFELLLIGVSTGGPKTLGTIIPKLPADLMTPVLIVQHMPPMFTASLAEHLNRDSALNIREAKEGEEVKRGDVLIAPGGKHMTIVKRAGGTFVKLNEDAPVNSCRPAVDVLFDSAAQCINNPILSVILTGMGEDGARGVENLKKKTCYCLSQSKETCVVYGMPQAIESRQLADEVVDAEMMATRITQLINRR